jgi:hypothetical protein
MRSINMAQNQVLSEADECKQIVPLLLCQIKLKIKNEPEHDFDDVKNQDWFKQENTSGNENIPSYFNDNDRAKIAAAMNIYLVIDLLETYYQCIKDLEELKKTPDKNCTKDEEKFYKDFKHFLSIPLKEPYSYFENGLENGLKFAFVSSLLFGPLCVILGPAALIGVGAAFVIGFIKGVYDNYQNLQELSETARKYIRS